MFDAPIYAQTAGGADLFSFIVPFALMIAIMYFLILRPQQKQMKARQEMLANIRRNDTVVTGGGMVGKVTKVYDDVGEIEVEIAANTKVRVLRSMVADVRVKGEPVKADTK